MVEKIIQIAHANNSIHLNVPLTASKSECNRALIIQALSKKPIELSNISDARDSQTMLRLLGSEDPELNVLDAGTTMRFLTAYCAAKRRKAILTGTARMQERPIKILVDALRAIGAKIDYLQNDGFPPIQINDFLQKKAEVEMAGNISSQYISAMLMIAPTLPMGLRLRLTGEIFSKPYIQMTLNLMQHFGINYTWKENTIDIAKQEYEGNTYSIESDWSGASYWYSIAALSEKANIKLLGLRENSFQGDKAIVEIMNRLGVKSSFKGDGVVLLKKDFEQSFDYNFSKCPDLAQTVAVICAAKGINARLSGLESLRIKETDRIAALQNELEKTGVNVEVEGNHAIEIRGKANINQATFDTYEDHRMAMAFAPLSLLGPITIKDPDVINKSYPDYWLHLKQAGFKIE